MVFRGRIPKERRPRQGTRLSLLAPIVALLGTWASSAGGLLPLAVAGEEDPVEPSLVRFLLDDAQGRPGEDARVTFRLYTEVPLQAISVAVNFDETRVRLLDVGQARSEDTPVPLGDVAATRIDNRDEEEGAQNREGFVHIEISAATDSASLDIPLGVEVPLAVMEFAIRGDAPYGPSPIRFEDIGPLDGAFPSVVLTNAVDIAGPAIADPIRLAPEDLRHGSIDIIGEVGFFMRGDADVSCERDISDAVVTLDWLFRGGPEPGCLDAADTDDSGVVELTDAVHTLSWLYMGGPPPSEPFLQLGLDETEWDTLDCVDGKEDERGCDGLPDSGN